MHFLAPDTHSLDAAEAAVDLGQPPGDVVFFSFTDSDLAQVASADMPGLRLAPLAKLRHPMSVDLYLDSVARHAKAILVRLLGGLDYWRYGAEELGALARAQGIALAILPGDGQPDPRLAELSTVSAADLQRLHRYWLEGGAANAAASLHLIAALGGIACAPPAVPVTLPKHGVYRKTGAGQNRAAIVFYRSILLAGDTAPIDALIEALQARDVAVAAYYAGSLKDEESAAWIERELKRRPPRVILNATAFSAQRGDGGTALDKADCPVLQIVMAGSTEAAWQTSTRGLSAADLAMHVALPELDGRLLAGAVSFKSETESNGFAVVAHRPHLERIGAMADKAAAWVRLAATPKAGRRIALVLSNYPNAAGRLAHAVGLDAPASVVTILERLRQEGYGVENPPLSAEDVIATLQTPERLCRVPLAAYRDWLGGRPAGLRERLLAAWGDPAEDPACDGATFGFAASFHGRLVLAVQPDRGSGLDAKAEHHDPALPPRHGYLAFYLWLREMFAAHAMIHLGTHGTLEWLPGKAAALSAECFPDAALGPLPVLYPFIVNNPGEAAQAKRRLGAVTLGHMTPPLSPAGLSEEAREVERLLEEYAGADGLDRRRTAHLGREIVARAFASGLAAQCGAEAGAEETETLARIDAFLCDIKELQIRHGLHVFGAPPAAADFTAPLRVSNDGTAESSGPAAQNGTSAGLPAQNGESEMRGLLLGLAARFVPPGPAGAPSRGRLDVLPTGRNLTMLDPRGVPTRTAAAIGRRMADDILLRYRQDHGEDLRFLVLDLWGSTTLRTGGDDLAQALFLLGVAPVWDPASNRVSGFEIVPLSRLDRPRVDVTLRVSGLFRDMFSRQIIMFDEAVRAVAALEEEAAWNPLRAEGERPLRIFGAAPQAYGAGLAERIQRGAWESRAELGRDYLAAGGYAYGAGLDGAPAHDAFAARVARADAHLHIQDHAEIDVLDDMTFAAFQGGFGAASAALGGKAALYHADLSQPGRPRIRSLADEVARIVHGRAANPRWIAGMMRHGHAGAAEMANALDALFAFAASAGVVRDAAFDALHHAYLEDDAVAAFLDEVNPAAAKAIRSRLAEALRRGLWQPRRNSPLRLLDETAQAAE